MSGLSMGSLGVTTSASTRDKVALLRQRLSLAQSAYGSGDVTRWRQLAKSSGLLSDVLLSPGAGEASQKLTAALTIFRNEEYLCSGSAAGKFCEDAQVKIYADLFRQLAVEAERLIRASAEDPGPPPPVYSDSKIEPSRWTGGQREAPTSGPVTLGPALPPDQATVQYGVQRAALTNQQALTKPGSRLSAQAQAAKIRGAWASARSSSRVAASAGPTGTGSISDARARQIILATQSQSQGKGLGTGAKVAIFGLLGVSVLALGASLFGRRG